MAKAPKFKFPGILSLFSQYTPQWLKDLVSKTKGGKEYVEDLTSPKRLRDTAEGRALIHLLTGKVIKQDEAGSDLNLGINRLMDDLEGRFDDEITKTETTLKEAKDKMSKTEKLLDEMTQEDKIKDIAQKKFLSELDEDDMTKHAAGGLKFRPPGLAKGSWFKGSGVGGWEPPTHDRGLMKSLLKLGTTMGMSEKELLMMAIKFNWDVSDDLRMKYDITDKDLQNESGEGLEWLLLKANPNLAKQPYSESKVNKMLSEEFEIKDEIEKPIQGDLFKKKAGGLISLVN